MLVDFVYWTARFLFLATLAGMDVADWSWKAAQSNDKVTPLRHMRPTFCLTISQVCLQKFMGVYILRARFCVTVPDLLLINSSRE